MPDFSFLLLHVESPASSAKFYNELLGIPIIEQSPTFAMLPLRDGVMLGLWLRAPGTHPNGLRHHIRRARSRWPSRARVCAGGSMSQRSWVAFASVEHVRIGRAQGFMQVCHGKAAPLRRLSSGDRVAYYSPTQNLPRQGQDSGVHGDRIVAARAPLQSR